ncbi:MAG: phytanoyl-CoA dioxygenase family protein [Myxococcales bacterium]|nr:phytanoyl-CoA dioxygenase [Myxococcales bacterium]HIK86820.1 phytanoyl-CoA dioxygenase [Myxococcales bacterium]
MTNPGLSDDALAKALHEIEEQGYTIIADAIPQDLIDSVQENVLRIERDQEIVPSENDFEGHKTIRIYNLLAHGEPFEQIPILPSVLPVVEGVLNDGCLISSVSSISIGKGESPQPIHADDQVIALPRPHQALVCNSMWAITDFTEANGATRVVPESHRDPNWPVYGSDDIESIPAEMKRGSVLVWNGSLWHGGGANQTDERRVGIAMNYCAGFLRQQENQQLGIPQSVAAQFSERLQRMVGYGVYRNLIGHIDKRDPRELLGADGAMRSIWDL